jgi:DNA-binding CsgD family transcriptional regulator
MTALRLSATERAALHYRAAGYSPRQAAAAIGTRSQWVDAALARMRRRVHARNNVALVGHALLHGILDPAALRAAQRERKFA